MKTSSEQKSGWFPVSRDDMERILDSAGPKDGPTLFTVWCALLSLANLQHSNDVVAPVNQIARMSGLAYRATWVTLQKLSNIGMIDIEARYSENPAKHNREPSLYKLKTSVQPYVEMTEGLCQNDRRVMSSMTEGLCSNDTTLMSFKSPMSADIYNNRTNKQIYNKIDCGVTTTQTHTIKSFKKWNEQEFFAKAQEANNGRLSDKELQAFCEYWTERGDGVKLMLFQRKQTFDVSRRIATWARNDFSTGKQSGDEEVCKENQRRKNELAGQLLKEIYES